MPSATVAADDAAAPLRREQVYGLSPEAWVQIAILTPLFIAVYWLVLRWLWDKTNPLYGEANWGHAICIPFVGLYYLYINREDLLKEPVEPVLFGNIRAWWRLWPAVGLISAGALAWAMGAEPSHAKLAGAVMVVGAVGLFALAIKLVFFNFKANYAEGGLAMWGGIALLCFGAVTALSILQEFIKPAGLAVALYGVLVLALDWGIGSLLMGLIAFAFGIWPGQNQFVQGCAMILTLFGVVLMLSGWRIMRYAWFPIIYLICGVPWPPLVYSYIASPLQTFAAKVAVVTLRFTGVNAYRSGTKINMGGITEPLRTLNVAEACAGLRSLMTFITVGMAVAFLSARPLWQKITITLSAIPIAIFCNVMRVAGQGLLDHYVSRQLSESFAHQFVGLVMLVPAFFMILAVGWMLDQIFVDEVDEDDAQAALAGGGRPAPASPDAGLVVEIPRKPRVQAIPRATAPAAPSTPKAPAIAPTPTVAKTQAAPVAPVAPGAAAAKPAVAPAKPQAAPAVMPPRPGIVPPRPGIVPPRPGIVPPRPNQPRPAQQQPLPQQPKRPPQPPQRPQPPTQQQEGQ
jgi:exosortase